MRGLRAALNPMNYSEPGRMSCFFSAGDNTIGQFETGGPSWIIRRAGRTDMCLDSVLCSSPVEFCDQLVVPLPAAQ